MSQTKISVVLPVRDRENEVVARIERVLEALVDLTEDVSEIVVVDDGSRDSTPEILEELHTRFPSVRVARHARPRGMEAAGQTGLERAVGELVFIQESDAEMRIDDLRRLLAMSDDDSVVAARAESSEEPIAAPLIRRLSQWATDAEGSLTVRQDRGKKHSIQMIRRPHLQRLAAEKGHRQTLEGNTQRIRQIQRVSV